MAMEHARKQVVRKKKSLIQFLFINFPLRNRLYQDSMKAMNSYSRTVPCEQIQLHNYIMYYAHKFQGFDTKFILVIARLLFGAAGETDEVQARVRSWSFSISDGSE